MAQHARPNSIHQTDDLRVQLRNWSALVVSTISGNRVDQRHGDLLHLRRPFSRSLRVRTRAVAARPPPATFFSHSRSPFTQT